MKKYEKYTPSSISGVDTIPAHWREAPLKQLVAINPESLGEKTDADMIINYIDIGNVNAYGEIKEIQSLVFKDAPSRARRIVQKGDVVVSTVRTYLKAIAAIESDEENLIASTGFAVLRADEKNVAASYLKYAVRGGYFIEEVVASSTGVSYPAISSTTFSNIKLLLPSYDEQRAIAAYLDQKTAQIDTLLLQKEILLQKLHLKRQALINEAVTQGLDPAAQRKPSGLAWLGDVPAHWEVKKLKRVLSNDKYAVKTGPFGSQLKADDLSDDGTIKVITQRNVLDNDFEKGVSFVSESKFEDLKSFTIEAGDILFTTRGTIGKAAIMPELDSPSILHPCLIKATINPTIVDPAWLLTFVNDSSYFVEGVKMESNSTVIDVIYSGTLKAVVLPVPPIAEQKQILQKTQEKSSLIDQATAAIHTQIQTLKAYRQSLISEVVTGKVDVRPAVPASEAGLPLWQQ